MKIIFIGGVGGSGTRVVASALSQNGVYIGSNLNDSLDNLDWPGLRLVVSDDSLTFDQKFAALQLPFRNFLDKMLKAQNLIDNSQHAAIAIKVPGSFFFLPYLCRFFDNVAYIHVIRHGLDMAFSKNRNQLRNWGQVFGLSDDNVRSQLKYWIKANEYAVNEGSSLLGDDFLLLRFESLCDETESEVKKIFEFLQLDLKVELSKFNFIKRPESFQRYRQEDISIFDSEDLLSLERLGYEI